MIENKQIISQKQVSEGIKDDNSIWLFIVALVIAVGFYAQFESEIRFVMMLSAVILITSFTTISYFAVKIGNVDKKFKTLMVVNILSSLIIPVIIQSLTHPIFTDIERAVVIEKITEYGVFSAGLESFSFLLYQMMAVVFVFIYIIFVFSFGIIHMISMLYLATNPKGEKRCKLFGWIYKKTYFKSVGWYITMVGILLLFSFAMASGLLLSLINSNN